MAHIQIKVYLKNALKVLYYSYISSYFFVMNKDISTHKNCIDCWAHFYITWKDLQFHVKISPSFWWEKYLIPPPESCPDCRSQKRMAWANQMNLYKRKCDLTGKNIISNISDDKPYTIYEINAWYGDDWDQHKYSEEFNFDKTFTEQFNKLLLKTPFPNLQRSPWYDENAEYTNYASKNRDSYLVFDSDGNRNASYCYSTNSSEDVFDCFRIGWCGNCYESIDSENCYDCHYIQNCRDCHGSEYLFDCVGCKSCFMSTGLRNKQYYIENVEYSKEEYENKVKQYKSKWRTELKEQFEKLKESSVRKYYYWIDNNDVSGDYLVRSKDSESCFDSRNLNMCKHVQQSFDDATNCHDCTEVWDKAELLYECAYVGINAYNNKFCSHALWEWSNMMYCFYTPACKDCFGCVGMHHKQYCILNKQYTKEQYNELVPKIIEHMKKTWEWWKYLPVSISPFGYNESHAQDYFPLSKKEALEKWFTWSDYEAPFPKVEKTIPADKLPDSIENIPDDILNWAIVCEITGKPFRIIEPELEFYRKHNLPIPKRHPNQRHLDRIKLRNPRKLYERNCDKCEKDIKTTYSPERRETVYCEECYNREVY